MDSRVGKNPENELEQQIPNCCFQFSHHVHHVHLYSFLARVFNKIPTDPHGNYGCHLWLSPPPPPCLCNCSDCGVTRCFLSSIPNLPNPWSSHQQLAIIKSAGRHSRLTCLCQIRQMCPAFPHPDREHRKNVYFLKFFL